MFFPTVTFLIFSPLLIQLQAPTFTNWFRFNEEKQEQQQKEETYHSKSASVHRQESDIWEINWSPALTHWTFALSFWKNLFIPMMHTSPCDK